jgi:aspartyl-tRNA synthetase
MGWAASHRDHGGVIFVDMRDRRGITQIVFDPAESEDVHARAEHIRPEFVIAAKGRVRARMEGMANSKLDTGEIEVICSELRVLNTSEPPPIQIDGPPVNEELRLKYRYLDLRRPPMQRNLELRHAAAQATRKFLCENDFLEIETPTFVSSTPEGARDYLVPSRVWPGKFYALPQSPQIYKQLLMVAGMDRYFQIVRCYRDEDLRADRQPEFTQIDVEMSFVQEPDVLCVAEGITRSVYKETIGYDIPETIPHLDYADAMSRYGSDKPDVRFGLEMVDVTEIAATSDFKVFRAVTEAKGIVSAINVKGGGSFSRKQLDDMTPFVAQYGAKGAAWMKVAENGLESNIAKFFGAGVQAALIERMKAQPGDLLVFVADQASVVYQALGNLRLKLGNDLNLIDKSTFAFLWVVNFPLLSWDEDERRWVANHHPFTSPVLEDLDLFASGGDPGRIRARAYDLVVNGTEIGGGSIRIHQRHIQQQMFDLLGITGEEAERRFGYLLNAFRYGAPPHGGIAFGFDRMVMQLAGQESIREVIAFPKTNSAASPMDGCPSEVDEKQLRELGIRLRHTNVAPTS